MSTSAPASVPSLSAIEWGDSARQTAFADWLQPLLTAHGLRADTLAPASADASFRRYFRIQAQNGASFIIMDAPPPQEDVRPFLQVAELIHAAGLNAPQVLAADADQGFLLLSDLGNALYLHAVQADDRAQADPLMRDAVAALVQWQLKVDASPLPAYDDALLRRELALFPQWCVQQEYGVTWTDAQQAQWQRLCDRLVASALAQPVAAVHRDWMPRNLMVVPAHNPGILDFQDAVRGPISYDLASMLRDAFLSWDEEQELDWAVRYWEAARKAGLPVDADFGEFWRQTEWMGLQRHLKVLGIFCRLKHRDGKPKYAEDLPRFFHYCVRVANRYREIKPLIPLLETLTGPLTTTAFSLR
jgi:aminoglycoside/choline kinase family phosphotransferase